MRYLPLLYSIIILDSKCDRLAQRLAAGILGEVEGWVSPLVSNASLQSVFIKYIQPPSTLEKLKALTSFVSRKTKKKIHTYLT